LCPPSHPAPHPPTTKAEGATCRYVESCDPSRTKNPAAWAAATPSPAAFLSASNDPADPHTCFRRDRDDKNQYVEPVTGRYLCDSVRGGKPDCAASACAGWSVVSYDAVGQKRFIKNHADGLIGDQTGLRDKAPIHGVGQGRYFLNKGCTYNATVADRGKCLVNMDEYGINLPDGVDVLGGGSVSAARIHAEICATNQLVNQ
jgi:hypothetical protein